MTNDAERNHVLSLLPTHPFKDFHKIFHLFFLDGFPKCGLRLKRMIFLLVSIIDGVYAASFLVNNTQIYNNSIPDNPVNHSDYCYIS